MRVTSSNNTFITSLGALRGNGGFHKRFDSSVSKMEQQMENLLPTSVVLVCNGLMRHHEPPLGTLTRSVYRSLLSRSVPNKVGGSLLASRDGMTDTLQNHSSDCGSQCYHVDDNAAGTCDGSSGIHILYTRPILRKNFRRTARSSGIRSNCMISHK